MALINSFSQDVIKKLNYYVYRLVDPRNGQTFYVGKGKYNRVFAHVNDAIKNYEGESYQEADEDDISLKIKQIRDIRNSGLEVIHIIQRYGLTEKEAFEVESAVMDCFEGLTNIQSGHASERGVNNAYTLQKILSCNEYKEQNDIKYCIIKIKDYWLNVRGSIYETVRGSWNISLDRVSKIPYVLASLDSVVQEVYEVEKWYEDPDFIGRYMFDGKPAKDEIRELFVNKRIPLKYRRKGMASPVLFHDGLGKL